MERGTCLQIPNLAAACIHGIRSAANWMRTRWATKVARVDPPTARSGVCRTTARQGQDANAQHPKATLHSLIPVRSLPTDQAETRVAQGGSRWRDLPARQNLQTTCPSSVFSKHERAERSLLDAEPEIEGREHSVPRDRV
jgi:hypothetical protein